ncbi:MAG: Holliday junction resolvase RuvX [Actinomycetota bacterium]|nr:Holliday junction resolvase RuvX [Actinomycetota bacterium]
MAISDPLGITAAPLEILEGFDFEELRSYVEQQARGGVGLVVVGLPLTKKGEEGEQARITRRYSSNLEKIGDIELVHWDERLTTVEAEKRLSETGHSLRGRRVDAEAAALILQSYLDYARGKEKEDKG